MLRAMPRLRCSSVKRRTPKNASRTIRKVQRSPRISIARPIEQGSCCTMSPYRDGHPGLRRPQRRAARRALVRRRVGRGSPRPRARPRRRVRGRLLRDLHAAPRRLCARRRAGAGRVEHDLAIGHTFGRHPQAARARAGGSGARGALARRPRARRARRSPSCTSRAPRRSTPASSCCPRSHALGLRSVGPTWSRPNAFAHGVTSEGGLTDAGRALVRACEELGILVDLSHLNERSFWDVAAIAERPLVVTHACAAALTPHERNLTDRQLDAVGESGGVVGVCFHDEFAGTRARGHRAPRPLHRRADRAAARRARLRLRRLRSARRPPRRAGPSAGAR